MSDSIISILSVKFTKKDASKAVGRFEEAERRYYQNDYESCLLKFGKFTEIIRDALIQITAKDISWPNRIDFPGFCDRMENLPRDKYEDSIRKYIPRGLRNIYDLRSGRGVAHEGKIDPNLLDASMSYSVSTWVLAELVRIFGNKTPDEAKKIVGRLYERKVPFVEEIDEGDFRLLLPKVTKKEEILLLLYHQGRNWVENQDLIKWIDPGDSRLVTNELPKLHRERLIVYRNKESRITQRGKTFVEEELWPKLQSELTFS